MFLYLTPTFGGGAPPYSFELVLLLRHSGTNTFLLITVLDTDKDLIEAISVLEENSRAAFIAGALVLSAG